MFKDLEIMKALRYLLIAVTVLSVLSLSAQTHQYATTQSQEHAVYSGAYVNPQMPVATMDYRHSDYMKSGSNLPQAAVEGTTTTYDEENSSPHKGHIRRGLRASCALRAAPAEAQVTRIVTHPA